MSDLIARLQDMVDFKHDDMDVAREAIEEIVKLEAQHDEQAATIARLWAKRNAEISARMKAEGEFSTMQRRIARQRRALAKLYQRRHDKNAALATARREGMEQLERYFRDAAAGTPLGYEDHQRGASVYNWLMYCATTIAAIRAAKEGSDE